MNNNPNDKNLNEEIEDETVDNEVDDIESEEKVDYSKISQEQFRVKMLKMFGIVIVGLVIILGIGFLISLFNKKNYTYSDVESVMKNAAISYFDEYKNKLPKSESEGTRVDVGALVQNKNMKELDYYLDGKSCKGNVTVEKISNKEYSYTPYLKCGNSYETIAFSEALIKNDNIVTDGYGLYRYNNEYVYRGANVDNYVKFNDSDNLFRVVKIVNDNEVVLIQDSSSTNKFAWDERYNQSSEDNSGINDYKNSLISEVLDYYYYNKIGSEGSDIYNNFEYDEESEFLSKNDRSKTIKFKACVANRAESDTSRDGSSECSVTYETKIGLLPVYDFLNASLDKDCTTTVSPSCQNYNYLVDDHSTWLANGNSGNSTRVYNVNLGYISSSDASYEKAIRPVIHLSDKVMLKGGKGTKSNPYIIE